MIVVDGINFGLHGGFPVSMIVHLVEGEFFGWYVGGVELEMGSKFL